MTLDTVGFGRSFPRIWIVPIGALVVVFGLAVVGVLSRSIVADFLAWWPVWVGLIVAAVVLRNRKFGRLRAAGLVPLAAIAMVALLIAGHYLGWSAMPSASQRLVGPDSSGVQTAELTAAIDGEIAVAGDGDSILYVVEPARGGGQFGIPDAVEERLAQAISIDLVEHPDRGLYTYAGWDIRLAPGPAWTLVLDGALSADLTGLNVAGAQFDGAGSVTLGQPSTAASIEVSGSFEIVVPAGASVSISGVATVPDTWTLTDSGAQSPSGGVGGWEIIVAPDATVRVTEG